MKQSIFALLFVVGCSAQPDASPPAPKDTMTAPFTLQLTNNPRLVLDKPVVVRARLERALVDATPLTFSVIAPPGVTVLTGHARETLVDAQSRTVERVYVLRASREVTQPVIIEVRAASDVWGATARQEVRFGADVQPLAQPPRTGPLLTWNGQKPSRGIVLTNADALP
jgi:hypothetical protein